MLTLVGPRMVNIGVQLFSGFVLSSQPSTQDKQGTGSELLNGKQANEIAHIRRDSP